ncbi:MAG: hypothetical protein JF606_06260 [Burkholderiales bacterium]|jgi:hypothetical protein|nr:hypothetical protein [Burkholderiales bacterium]
MKRLIAEWLWRAAVICALVWIALELHYVHEDMMQPVDEAPVVTADTDGTEQGIERVRSDVASLLT